MAAGGKRKPPGRSAPSGPGKFSKRDEANQPIREPDIDQLDLQYGDRTMLTEAQRIARLPAGSAVTQRPRGEPRPSGLPPAAAGLPPWIFNMPSSNPDEPPTAGLDGGPGPGSDALALQQPPDDVRELTLLYLSSMGNPDAGQALRQLQSERAAAAMPPMAPTPVAPGGPPGTVSSPVARPTTPAPPELGAR